MVENITYKRKSRFYSFLSTSLLAALLLLFLLFYILHTPNPPYPEGGGGAGNGIELNLGFSDAGAGNNPQELAAEPEKTEPQPVTQTQPENEKILTQDVEDAPSINEKVVDAKKNKKDVKKETPIVPKKKEPEKPKQVVNQNALFPSKSKQASADGNKNSAGNQGDPNGSLAAKAFGGKNGSGGSGGGTGGGNGKGTGLGNGPGVDFDIKDRTAQNYPLPEYNKQVEGVVVVDVTVDKEGKVTQAEPGKKGTTIVDENLWAAAQKAAYQTRFDRKPDAQPFQKGKITYRFRLQ